MQCNDADHVGLWHEDRFDGEVGDDVLVEMDSHARETCSLL